MSRAPPTSGSGLARTGRTSSSRVQNRSSSPSTLSEALSYRTSPWGEAAKSARLAASH